MNRHHPHHIFLFAQGTCRREVRIPIPHLTNELQKTKEAAEIRFFVIRRPIRKHPQVGLSDEAAGLRPHIIIIARFPVKLPDEFRHPHAPGQRTPTAQTGDKGCRFLIRRSQQSRKEIAFRRSGADLRQFFPSHPHNGGMQNRRQGNILMGVINDGKEGEDNPHLHLSKIPFVKGRIRRHIGSAKRLHQRLRLSFGGAQEYRYIPPAKGTIAFFFLIVNLPAGGVKRLHLLSQERSFPGEAGEGLLILSVTARFILRRPRRNRQSAGFQNVKLGGFSGKRGRMHRVIRLRVKRRIFIIGQFQFRRYHHLREDVIDRRQYFRAAAIILLHVNGGTAFIVLLPIRSMLFLKKPRVGQPETVDTLLHIPNGEEIAPIGHPGKDGLLHAVHILIFIDHDLSIAALHLLRHFFTG